MTSKTSQASFVNKNCTTMPNIDFGELKNDSNFTATVNKFAGNLDDIDASITKAVDFKKFDELSTEEKVKFDNYLAYTANSLFWMFVKLQGLDPNTHGIKNELSRVREAMMRDKQIYEKKTLRPVLNKAAAGRFIKHGLHDRSDRENGYDNKELNAPQNKKIKFNNDSD